MTEIETTEGGMEEGIEIEGMLEGLIEMEEEETGGTKIEEQDMTEDITGTILGIENVEGKLGEVLNEITMQDATRSTVDLTMKKEKGFGSQGGITIGKEPLVLSYALIHQGLGVCEKI